MARGAELSIGPCRGNLGQHVLVQVALGVAVLHVNPIDELHHLVQESRCGDDESGLAHEPCKHPVLVAHLLHVVKDGHAVHGGAGETTKHRLGVFVLELIPTKRFLRFGEEHLLHGDAHQGSLLFLLQLLLVQGGG